MMLQLKDKKFKIFFYLLIFLILSTIQTQKQVLINLKISEIEVKGLSSEDNLIIKNSLKELENKNLLFVDKKIFDQKIKDFNLIDTYNVKKIFPNKIIIEIEKTKFVGVFLKNDKKYFIGKNGKLIDYYKNNYELPLVLGNPKLSLLIEFFKVIENSKFNFSSIKEIRFLKSGRWDIKDKNNTLIKLPSQKLLSKLNLTGELLKNEKFQNTKVIDLRIENQIIVTDG